MDLKNKLRNNNAAILESDKTYTPVIMFIDDYNRKVQEYITQNGYIEIKDPTNKYKKIMENMIKENLVKINIREKNTQNLYRTIQVLHNLMVYLKFIK